MHRLIHRLIAASVLVLLAFPAAAQICSPVPVTLSAGTPARASDVMSNFNSTVDCVNTNAAKNGANSDITSITGLTTPLSQSQGGTSVYYGAVSSTVSNAYTTTSVTPSLFSFTNSKIMNWVAPASNTATATMNPNSLGATTIYRIVPAGAVELAAGQIANGGAYLTGYNGTQQLLLNPTPIAPSVTVYTSGSGTYTTPTGALYLKITLRGGGAGGTGSGSGGGGAGGAGGNTTFSTFAANGGSGAGGGTASGCSVNLPGNRGSTASVANGITEAPTGGGRGGGAGGGAVAAGSGGGVSGDTNSGGGGSGGGSNAGATTVSNGAGGGEGGFCYGVIGSPAASYSYAVGAAGTSGTAGVGGATGGAGAAGVAIVEAHFQ